MENSQGAGKRCGSCGDCYVCFLYPANYRQSAWKQGRLYTTACGCDQLHIMGWLWLTEKRKRLAYCHRQFPRGDIWIDGFSDGIDSFLKGNRSEDPVIKGKKDNKRLDRKRSSC